MYTAYLQCCLLIYCKWINYDIKKELIDDKSWRINSFFSKDFYPISAIYIIILLKKFRSDNKNQCSRMYCSTLSILSRRSTLTFLTRKAYLYRCTSESLSIYVDPSLLYLDWQSTDLLSSDLFRCACKVRICGLAHAWLQISHTYICLILTLIRKSMGVVIQRKCQYY